VCEDKVTLDQLADFGSDWLIESGFTWVVTPRTETSLAA
jgi:hypothetical protein